MKNNKRIHALVSHILFLRIFLLGNPSEVQSFIDLQHLRRVNTSAESHNVHSSHRINYEEYHQTEPESESRLDSLPSDPSGSHEDLRSPMSSGYDIAICALHRQIEIFKAFSSFHISLLFWLCCSLKQVHCKELNLSQYERTLYWSRYIYHVIGEYGLWIKKMNNYINEDFLFKYFDCFTKK